MKKRLVTFLLISALAATVFAGCSKSDAEISGEAATGEEAAVIEEANEVMDELAAAAETADAAEVAAVADTAAAVEAEAEGEEFIDEEDETEEVTDEAVAAEAPAGDSEDLVVDPGTTYTVRFGGNIYSTPEEIAENVMYYANPGDYLNVVERLDDFWYKVTYYLAGEGIEHTGYIQIQ